MKAVLYQKYAHSDIRRRSIKSTNTTVECIISTAAQKLEHEGSIPLRHNIFCSVLFPYNITLLSW